MKDTNKPQWLIDAENDIKAFEETKYGKMTSRQFINSENARNVINKKAGGIATGKKSKELQKITGQFASIKTKEHQTNAAKKAGAKNVESGSWKKTQEAAHKTLKIQHTCPHCNKTLSGLNYRRWHGDNCKLKQNPSL